MKLLKYLFIIFLIVFAYYSGLKQWDLDFFMEQTQKINLLFLREVINDLIQNFFNNQEINQFDK